MSKDKYPSMFSAQMEAIAFIIFQIFFARRAVLKIGEYFPAGRTLLLVFEKFTRAYLFQIALEIM